MTETQYQTLLQTIADVQISLDSIDLRLERMTADVDIAPWAGSERGQRTWDGISEAIEAEHVYPPPERGNPGAAAGITAIAAFVGFTLILFVTLYWAGSGW